MSRVTLRRLVSATALAALTVGVLPAGPAFAAEPREISAFACPDGEVPDPGFSDDDGNFHEDAIHCVVWYGIAQGRTSSTYAPERHVTRGQMATFIGNVLQVGGVVLPSDPPDAFEDDDGTQHEQRINQLAQLGVVEGTSETTYEPNASVNRAQMASFLNRAYEEITGAPLTTEEDFFNDDNDTFHEDNINAVAAAGIAAGTTETTYSPGGAVARAQMASFLAREVDLLVEENIANLPGDVTDNRTALDVPELVRVEEVSDTQLRFVFDEPLNASVATESFGVYSYAAERTEASTTSRDGDRSVIATFTAEAVAQATLAGVATGAVQDADGNTSSEGHAGVTDVDLPDGSTVAPDLLEVSVGENQASFTFDEDAFALANTGYHVVLADGTVETSTDAEPTGNGTTTHTVAFDELTSEEAGQVVYGYVDAGTVSDEEGDGNPLNGDEGDLNVLQTAAVSDDGATTGPDLAEVSVDGDTVVYRFDENVVRAEDTLQQPAGDFAVYFVDATTASADSVERSSQTTFTATFAEGTLTDLVAGAQVPAGTVEATDGDANTAQEVGFALAFEAGDTVAPELRGATISQVQAEDGTNNRNVRFTFDAEVGAILDQTAFKVYAEDGTSQTFVASSTLPPSVSGCFIDGDNATVVECRVNDDEEAELYGFLASAVVATVERGAVQDASQTYANAEGAAIVGGSVS